MAKNKKTFTPKTYTKKPLISNNQMLLAMGELTATCILGVIMDNKLVILAGALVFIAILAMALRGKK